MSFPRVPAVLLVSFLALALAGTAGAQTSPAAQAAFAAGQALEADKRHADAADKFQAAVTAEPSFALGWYMLAAARRRAGQCAKAIPAYRRYAELQPQEIEPYYGLGLCLRDAGNRKAAAEALARYVSLEKRPASQRWVEHARSVLEDLNPPSPPAASPPAAPAQPPAASARAGAEGAAAPAADAATSAAIAPYNEAQKLRDSGRIEEALSKFRKAVAADPTHMQARAALGELLLKVRRDDEAITVFRAAVEKNPSYPLAWYDLAFALRMRGKMADAVDAYQHYIKLRPTDPDPYFGLGRALQKLGRNQAAAQAYAAYVAMEKRPSEQRWVQAAEAQIKALGAAQTP